jgi:hypothetical protein
LSCPGSTRASIRQKTTRFDVDELPGQVVDRRASRFCPAMTSDGYSK